jgi:hypothetical protein
MRTAPSRRGRDRLPPCVVKTKTRSAYLGFRIRPRHRIRTTRNATLAGVACDGARYPPSKTRPRRDRLREEVLRSLGLGSGPRLVDRLFDTPDLQTERLITQVWKSSGLARSVDENTRVPPAPRRTYRGATMRQAAPGGVSDEAAARRQLLRLYTPPSDSGGDCTLARALTMEALKRSGCSRRIGSWVGPGAFGEADLARALRDLRHGHRRRADTWEHTRGPSARR